MTPFQGLSVRLTRVHRRTTGDPFVLLLLKGPSDRTSLRLTTILDFSGVTINAKKVKTKSFRGHQGIWFPSGGLRGCQTPIEGA